MMSRVNNPQYILLDTTPCELDKNITGSRLPTCHQVLLCFLAHCTDDDKNLRGAAKKTITKVIPFYERARVPHITTCKMEEEVLKLHQTMRSILKINHNRREGESFKQKLSSFKDTLESTMKFWPRSAMNTMTNEEDKAFLQSMMSDRVATMGSVDGDLSATEKKVMRRNLEQEARENLEKSRVQDEQVAGRSASELHRLIGDEEESEAEQEGNEDTYTEGQTPRRKHRRELKTGTSAFWAHDILKSPVVVETAVRNHVSPTVLSALTHAYVTATGGDHTRVNLSYRTAYRYKIQTVVTIATAIKDCWVPPQISMLHWDGKLMNTLTNDSGKQERLPVLLSGEITIHL